MARPILDGVQDFSQLREKNYFYVDKTSFIREWWDETKDNSRIPRERIKKYGFAFKGKAVLIGQG